MKTEEGGVLLFYYTKDESSDLESQLNSKFLLDSIMQRMGIVEEQLLIETIHKDAYIVLLSQKCISETGFLLSCRRLP